MVPSRQPPAAGPALRVLTANLLAGRAGAEVVAELVCRKRADVLSLPAARRAARRAGARRPVHRPALLAIDHVPTDRRCAVLATSAHWLTGSDHRALYAELRLPAPHTHRDQASPAAQ